MVLNSADLICKVYSNWPAYVSNELVTYPHIHSRHYGTRNREGSWTCHQFSVGTCFDALKGTYPWGSELVCGGKAAFPDSTWNQARRRVPPPCYVVFGVKVGRNKMEDENAIGESEEERWSTSQSTSTLLNWRLRRMVQSFHAPYRTLCCNCWLTERRL